MSVYAIGDIQGCYDDLMRLLDSIHFNENIDTLWFVGDLVNRGPKSLETLRFINSLPNKICVLGNHDFHLLAVNYGVRQLQPKDTLKPIIDAPDKDELMYFLEQQPVFHFDPSIGYAMVHAGIHSHWSFDMAKSYSNEISAYLQSDPKVFLEDLFGDTPNYWDENFTGIERMRALVNFFTRVRVTTKEEHLIFDYKGTYENRPLHSEAWFNLRNWQESEKLIFGHWAGLNGHTPHPNLFAIDTGCVWGNHLTAIKL